MGLTISSDQLNIIGIVYSGVAVALALFQCFVKKAHARAIDYIQWGYFLSTIYTTVTVPFSSQLYIGSSLISLNPDAVNNFYCPMGNYVCAFPFALSFLVIYVGLLVIFRFITIPEKVRMCGFTFQRVYRFAKGIIRWFYLPLVYVSIYNLFAATGAAIIAEIVVLAILIAFPCIQIALYKFFDPEQPDSILKFIELASYAKAALFALLLVLAQKYGATSYFYYISFILIAYAGFYALMYQFKFEKAGRVFYIFGEVVFYFLYSLYVSQSQWLSTYYIDLFALGIILLIDIIYLIMETTVVYRQWKNSASEVVPQQSFEVVDTNRKKNRYEVQDGADLARIGSKDNLNDSRVSSGEGLNNSSINKKGNNARPRPEKR